MAQSRDDEVESGSAGLLIALQARAEHLLANLRAYQTCLRTHGKQQDVELRTFKRGVESELKSQHTALQSVTVGTSASDLSEFDLEEIESKRLHALRSSNLPFYEAVWAVASQCTCITALGKRVYCDGGFTLKRTKPVSDLRDRPTGDSKSEKKSAVVDIVAQDGLEWIKISTVTEKRLLFEMAKEGWEGYGGDSDSAYDSEEEEDSHRDKRSEQPQLELVKLAHVLHTVSRNTRVRFRHPRVRFVLPKVEEGLFDNVDAVIADIRSLGIQVTCKNDNSTNNNTMSNTTQSLQTLNLNESSHTIAAAAAAAAAAGLTYLLPSPSMFNPPPTPTLNIDCTILLALISDISHITSTDLPPHPTTGPYHKAITRQIDNESINPLLPTTLYPFITNRKLVCTSHAAQRMREIVNTMGTTTERHRADILLAEHSYQSTSTETLQTALKSSSCHPVPSSLQLPIEIVEFEAKTGLSSLSSSLAPIDQKVMHKVHARMELSAINESVFLYGWRERIVTVTSNRVIALGLVKCINEVLDDEEKEREKEDPTALDEDGAVKGEGEGEMGNDAMQFEGPKMFVCETARSLIGKEKQG